MKLSRSILVLTLFALCSSAQTLPNPPAGPNVTVLQKKWRIDVRNRALEKNPVESMNEQLEDERQRIATERQNEILRERGMPDQGQPARVRRSGPRGLSVKYVYEVKVRNTGAKSIRTLIWDYVFLDPDTEQEMGRRRFVSKVRIKPGTAKNVVMQSTSPPTMTIDAAKAGNNSSDQFSEKVVIERVEFADGSVWQASPT